jgi:hypothetical protein
MTDPRPRRPRRRAAAAGAALGVLAVLAPAAAAQAAPVTTITSPGPGAIVEYDYARSSQSEFDVEGTTADPTVTRVEIVCLDRRAGGVRKTPIGGWTLAEDGVFSARVTAPSRPCRLAAVPQSDDVLSDDALSRYAGPVVRGGVSDIEPHWFAVARSGLGGYARHLPAGDCGLQASRIASGDAPDVSTPIFYCSGNYGDWIENRAGVTVDGRRASLRFGDGASTVQRTVDPLTGDLRIVEVTNVRLCEAGPDSPCARRVDGSGVQLRRTTVQDHDGRQIRHTDEWVSTDGRAHGLQLLSLQIGGPGEPAPILRALTAPTATPTPTSWSVPWVTGDAFRAFALDEVVPEAPAGSPATIRVRADHDARDGDPFSGQGAITWETSPQKVTFLSERSMLARFHRTVPADGSVTMRTAYSQAPSAREVGRLVADAHVAWGLPDPDAVVDPPVTPEPPKPGPAPSPGPAPRPQPGPKAGRITPQALSLTTKGGRRDRKAPYRFALRGRLALPAGVPAATCRGVAVTLRVTARRKGRTATIATLRPALTADCRWSATLKLTKKAICGTNGRLTVRASSARTAALAARAAPRLSLRAG